MKGHSPANPRTSVLEDRVALGIVLGLGLALRLAWLWLHSPWDFLQGGDGPWYLRQGWLIAHNALPHPMTTAGPVYPLLLALGWLLFPASPFPADVTTVPGSYLHLVHLVQIAASTLLVWLAYLLARQVSVRPRAGLLAAMGVSLGPAFVMEPLYLLTELTFTTWLTLSIYLCVRTEDSPSYFRYAGIGLVTAVTAMTRPVALILPFLLAIPFAARDFQGRRRSAVLLATFLIALLPWAFYLFRTTGSVFPQGLAANLWIGAADEGEWEGMPIMAERSREIADDAGFAREALSIIAADPFHWLQVRARNLAGAILTPHGIVNFGGPALKDMLAEWLKDDRSAASLWAIVRLPSFTPKLVVYAFHYVALVFGALGAAVSLSRFGRLYPIYAGVAFLLVAHAVLTALPRYLFPAEALLWVFAAIGLTWTVDRLRRARALGHHGAAKEFEGS